MRSFLFVTLLFSISLPALSFFWNVHFFKLSPPSGIFFNGKAPVESGLENNPQWNLSDSCSSCHSQISNEWRKDRHGLSWDNEPFQKAYDRETKEWCIHCHAPLLSQKESILEGYKSAADTPHSEGINCAACHIRGGRGVSLEYLKKPEFCAECHQFNVPVLGKDEIHYTSDPMQNTYEEWKSSEEKKRCQDCHFKDHHLVGPHNGEWLKKRFSHFHAESREGLILISFDFDGPGHRAPTGDLFRSFVLELSGDSEFRSDVYFSKRWARFFESGFLDPGILSARSVKRNSGFPAGKSHITIAADQRFEDTYVRLTYYFHDPVLGGDPRMPVESVKTIIWQDKVKKRP